MSLLKQDWKPPGWCPRAHSTWVTHFCLDSESPTEFWVMTQKGALPSEALLCAPSVLGLSQEHQGIWPCNQGGQLTQAIKFQMHMGVTAEWAALALNSIPGLLKSHLTSQPLLALLLFPPCLQGSFCPHLEETVLLDITWNLLAACSLNTPGAFPALSFWSHLPLPLEYVSHHPAFRSYPYLQTYLTCHLFQEASLGPSSQTWSIFLWPPTVLLVPFLSHTQLLLFLMRWAYAFLSPSCSGSFLLLGSARSSALHW